MPHHFGIDFLANCAVRHVLVVEAILHPARYIPGLSKFLGLIVGKSWFESIHCTLDVLNREVHPLDALLHLADRALLGTGCNR